ncbi:Mediator of RNA polymerase II transcription subunit 23 [Smittium mucronatum]|uniref:Mediator of RNA polymerase II transcription subunit 23 n=1 Tax=Smittium mucronatum TaxID=133383 RepID=A0A1R0H7J3_9FUNG|nr:Mediator of RNA polymerase II transcription subunit 23 [Smittium mucronatum]
MSQFSSLKKDNVISNKFGILLEEVKYLFVTDRTRSWDMAFNMIDEIVSWAFELIYSHSLSNDAPIPDLTNSQMHNNIPHAPILSSTSNSNLQSFLANFISGDIGQTPNFAQFNKTNLGTTEKSFSIHNQNRLNSAERPSFYIPNHSIKPFISEKSCRRIVRHIWYQLVSTSEEDSTFFKNRTKKNSVKHRPWKNCFQAFLNLVHIFMGSSGTRSYPSFISHFNIIQDLDPGAAVAENGILPIEMQYIVDVCVARKRRLARVAFPPDTMWPMVSHASRQHTEKHIYDQIGYACLRDTLSRTELERGPSAEKYIADLLYQRAAIDEVYTCIKNHRMMKKKTIKELQRYVYIPQNSSKDDMLEDSPKIQPPTQDKISNGLRSLEMIEDSKLLLDVLVQKIEYTVRYIQKCSDFKRPVGKEEYPPEHVAVPKNLRFWERINEIADQIFFFVQTNAISYNDIHDRLYSLVLSESSEISTVPRLEKDNTLIWLLLQLFHIEKVAVETISKDFSSSENFLADFLDMYSEDQIHSKDSFYLRDLSLQSVLSHQQQNIKDRVGIKLRHPKINKIMKYTQAFYKFQTQFGNDYKKNVIDNSFTLFQNPSIEEVIKIASISQARQYIVPNTIYGYLVPFNYKDVPLQNPNTRYLKGGIINYKVLDYINVGSKHRLLQIIYKMMLSHELGPQFQFQVNPPKNDVTCVSPYVLDVVYKLLYNSPYTNELMMKEILEKLRLCDKVMAMVKLQYDPDFLVALMNPDYHGVPITSYPHIYKLSEEEIKLQYVKPVQFWFNCSLLYRNAIMVVSRIMLIRGSGDISGLSIDECLIGLSNRPSNWAPQVLQYMAPQVLDHYMREKRHIHSCPKIQSVNEILEDERIGPVLRCEVVDQTEIDQVVQILIAKFSISVQKQTLFLCLLWQMEYNRILENKKTSTKFVSIVRKVLLRFQKSFKTEHSSVLMDYAVKQVKSGCLVDEASGEPILSGDKYESQLKKTFAVLERFVWLFMFIRNEHVLYGLVRGEFDIRNDPIRMRLIHYLLIESPGFSARLDDWKSLDFPGRYWEAEDYYSKQIRYLNKNPEYFEYEYYLLLNNEPIDPPTQLALPMYYENEMVRLLPVLEYALDRLIEAEQTDLLIELLDHFGMLFRLDQVPLNSLYNILFVYFGSPTLHNSRLIRSLSLSLLDLTQQQFSPELETFLLRSTTLSKSENLLADLSYANSLETNKDYVLGLMDRIGVVLSRNTSGLELKPGLPEIHYREIPNPVLLVLTECIVEVLIWWCISQESKTAITSPLLEIDTSREFDEIKDELDKSIKVWKKSLSVRASEYTLVHTWLNLVLEISIMPTTERKSHDLYKKAKCIPTTYFHVTGIFANTLPIDLMAAPYIKFLVNIVFFCKELDVTSTIRPIFNIKNLVDSFENLPKDYYVSNWDFERPVEDQSTVRSSDIFENYVHNLRDGTQNLPNAYSTMLHSILHYGGMRAFLVLSDTIKQLADGDSKPVNCHDFPLSLKGDILSFESDLYARETLPGEGNGSFINTRPSDNKIHTDIQLLYIISAIAPILYRLELIPNLFSSIIENLFRLAVQISNRLYPLKLSEIVTTVAFEVVVDFFYFSKSKFSQSKFDWKNLESHYNQMPNGVKNRFRNLIYD